MIQLNSINLLNLQAEADKPHVNRRPFKGILTKLDKPSDQAPKGARGHQVILTRKAAESAIGGLVGMGVGYLPSWDGHGHRSKCGVITSAWIKGTDVMVSGFIYAKDFSDVIQHLETGVAMGMSFELADAHVENMRAPIWTITRTTFTGAAILLRDKAAYRGTSFKLLAAA